ncbi:cyclic nucleotide-gated cation channel alpha-3-like [Lineus longissimus]|uniref:cyclic nucleotide-gated cation channel alpha-3-like n=1 Tax=Lineus longissimus TaxID=88925 RepID=UPI00315D109D
MKPKSNGASSHVVEINQLAQPTKLEKTWNNLKSCPCIFGWIVNPYGNIYYRWLIVISIAVVYNMLTIITRAVFQSVQRDYTPMWFTFDYMFDGIYIADMIVRFRTGYLEQGQLVRDRKKLMAFYAKTYLFKLDILCIIPADVVAAIIQGTSHYNPIVRLNRLLKFPRLREALDRTETRTNFPNAFRITHLIFYIFVIMHWFACLYFALSTYIGTGADTWVFPNTSDPRYESVGLQYVYCLYWSTLTLTTIGEIATPQTDLEYLFVITSFLAGVLIFATIVGSVGNMIGNLNIARTEFQGKVDAIKRYMEFRKVSKYIQKRVFQWFEYLWLNRQSMDEEVILALLPDKLKAEILMNVHLDTLRRVRILRGCEPGLLQELVLRLKLQVFSPGDYVCRKGDVGREMYIVKRGCLSVVSDDGEHKLATLTEGSVFGEISILDIPGNKTGNRRTANVRSEGYSDLFCLAKEALWSTLSDYPDAKERLIMRGKQLLIDQKLVDEKTLEEAEITSRLPERGTQTSWLDENKPLALEAGNLPDEVKRIIKEMEELQLKLHKIVCEMQAKKYIGSDVTFLRQTLPVSMQAPPSVTVKKSIRMRLTNTL